MSTPSSRICPSVGRSNPAIIRRVVVLPQPDGPSNEKNSPDGIFRLMPATAVKSPKRFIRSTSCTSPPAIVRGAYPGPGATGQARAPVTRWDDAPVSEPTTTPPATAGQAASRREIRSLLAGYWSFGQYWGVWVILVFEFQRFHDITDARIGIYYTLLSAHRRRRDVAGRATAPAALAVHDHPALAGVAERGGVRDGLPADHVDPARLRARGDRQRVDRRLPQRRRAARRGADRQAGAAVDACDVRARGHHRSPGRRCDPRPGHRLPDRTRIRGAGPRRHRDVDVVERSEGATRRGRADAVLDLRAVPSAEAPGARPGRAVARSSSRDRWTCGRGSTSAISWARRRPGPPWRSSPSHRRCCSAACSRARCSSAWAGG